MLKAVPQWRVKHVSWAALVGSWKHDWHPDRFSCRCDETSDTKTTFEKKSWNNITRSWHSCWQRAQPTLYFFLRTCTSHGVMTHGMTYKRTNSREILTCDIYRRSTQVPDQLLAAARAGTRSQSHCLMATDTDHLTPVLRYWPLTGILPSQLFMNDQ